MNEGEFMTKKIAMVTNVCDYAGPPAVEALVSSGFTVIGHDPSFRNAESRNRYSKEHPEVITVEIQDPHDLILYVYKNFKTIQVLISNDNYPAIHGPISNADVNDLRATIESIIIFPFRLMKSAIPVFKNQRSGKIIFITSCRTELSLPEGSIPDIARSGANALVKSTSLELAPYNVPVNAIAPNYLYSEAYFPKSKFIDDPKGKAFIEDVVPVGRLGRPEEIGEIIAFLSEMKGSFQTGAIIKFSGGWPAAPKRPV